MQDKPVDILTNISEYGEVIKKLISSVFRGQVVYDSVDHAFEYALNQTSNNLKFPFISFYHDNAIDLDMSRNSFNSYRYGKLFETSTRVLKDNLEDTHERNEKISKSVQNLYINVRYIFDIWGTDRLSCEKVSQELVFWLFYNQQVTIKYMGVPITLTFEIEPSIVDNTDLTTYHSNGKLYRYTLSVILRAALFRSVDYFNVLDPQVSIEITDRLGKSEEN